MILFMEYKTLEKLKLDENKTVVYNLSSFKEGFEKLPINPPHEIAKIRFSDPKSFDMIYMEFLLKEAFYPFMKIVDAEEKGKNVVLLVTIDENWDYITESLQKVLQQRYGFLSYVIEDEDDYNSIDLGKGNSYNKMNLYNLDNDLNKYRELYIKYNGSEEFEKTLVEKEPKSKFYL